MSNVRRQRISSKLQNTIDIEHVTKVFFLISYSTGYHLFSLSFLWRRRGAAQKTNFLVKMSHLAHSTTFISESQRAARRTAPEESRWAEMTA